MALKEIHTSDSEEEIVFNFQPSETPQIQIVDTTSEEGSEETEDSDDSVSERGDDGEHPSWEEESDENIIYHIFKKPYKRSKTDSESEESFMIKHRSWWRKG
jgi:hypothetical protein